MAYVCFRKRDSRGESFFRGIVVDIDTAKDTVCVRDEDTEVQRVRVPAAACSFAHLADGPDPRAPRARLGQETEWIKRSDARLEVEQAEASAGAYSPAMG